MTLTKREYAGNTNLHCVEKSLWQGLWICHKTEYMMMMMMMMMMVMMMMMIIYYIVTK